MPEYLSPGVYVEEIDAGPKPIEGVSTSTVGAVGVTTLGPTSGKPELVTSFAEFERKFGGFLKEPDAAIVNKWVPNPQEGGQWWQFPLAVKGFFDNGGQRMYVKRVFSSIALSSTGVFGQGLVSEIMEDAGAKATELKLEHLTGVSVGTALGVFRGDTSEQLTGNYQVQSYNPASGKVVIAPGLDKEVKTARRDFVEIRQRSGEPLGDTDKTLEFSAKSKGKWGDWLSVRARPMTSSTLTILLDPNLGGGSFTAKTVGVTAAAGSPPKTTVELADTSGLKDGDKVMVLGKIYQISNLDASNKKFDITPNLGPGASWPAGTDVTRVRTDAADLTSVTIVAGPPPKITVVASDVRDIADGDHVLIDGKEFVVSGRDEANSRFDVAPVDPGHTVTTVWPGGTKIKRLGAANAVNAGTLNVWAANALYPGALLELDNGKDKETLTVQSVAGNTVTLAGNLTKVYYEGNKLRLIEAEVSVRYAPPGAAPVEELFTNLRLHDDKTSSFIVASINARSKLIEVKKGQGLGNSLAKFPSPPKPAASPTPSRTWFALTGGDDKLAELSVDDFIGVDAGSGKRTGVLAMEDIDEISICLVPGIWALPVHNALVQHCEGLKDRFAIIDPRNGLSIEEIREFREPYDSKYAALYYPWIEVRDPLAKKNVDVAPSAHMAGIYARVDVERGVHKAPANEVIRGITKISQDVTKREHDMLNPKNINVLRFFPGRGNRVWGARVVTSDAAWKYINVRRLFIFVEESIDEGTQWVVFEPNDEPLWARVRQTITNFLTSVWRSGALQGAKPDEAFFVKCDHSTMTQDDIDNGRLICLIGIAPVKPAEFVIFRIQQKTIESKPS